MSKPVEWTASSTVKECRKCRERSRSQWRLGFSEIRWVTSEKVLATYLLGWNTWYSFSWSAVYQNPIPLSLVNPKTFPIRGKSS